MEAFDQIIHILKWVIIAVFIAVAIIGISAVIVGSRH